MKPSPLVLTGLAALLTSCAASPCMASPTDAAILLPWGDGAIALAHLITAFLVPLAITAATAALARIAGPLQVLITTSLVERLVRNVGDYAVNAVAGAVRGRTLSVPVGSAVIARAVQRALDQAPAWLVTAAGGAEGLAEKVFRSLPLDEEATTGNTLPPALDALRADRDRAAETRFERSMTDLCRAALDHVDRQHRLGLALQRLVAQRAGPS